jgi:hypothetical protein
MSRSATELGEIELGEAAGECVPVLGEDMTAYLAGANSVAQFDGWLAGAAEPAAPQRLSAVLQVLRIFAAENLSSYAKEWLRNVGSTGTAPARIIREAIGDDHAVKDVFLAAAAWIVEHRQPQTALAA